MPFPSREGPLFNPDPAAYLPHRYPFLMIDRIQELEPGITAKALRRVTDSPEGFPQILLLECVAQLAGITAGLEQNDSGFLAAVNHSEFYDMPCAGDTLSISVRVVKSFGRLCLVEGEVAKDDGTVLLKASMTIGIGRL